eukprot:gene11615-4857_t
MSNKKTHKIEVMKAMFKAFDRDGNGFIDRDELYKTMNDDLDVPITRQEVEDILQEADVNRDGKISYEEFVKSITSFTGE